jgi:hypothetical protein
MLSPVQSPQQARIPRDLHDLEAANGDALLTAVSLLHPQPVSPPRVDTVSTNAIILMRLNVLVK